MWAAEVVRAYVSPAMSPGGGGSGGDEPAVICCCGLGCRFPGGVSDGASFWNALSSTHTLVGEPPSDRCALWDWNHWAPVGPSVSQRAGAGRARARPGASSTRRAGWLADGTLDRFDAAFFKVSPREAAAMDPQQRLALQVAVEALIDARVSVDGMRGSQTGVFVGAGLVDHTVGKFSLPSLTLASAGDLC